MQFDSTRVSTRTARLSVPDEAGQGLAPNGPGDLLHPDTRNRVRVYSVLVTPTGDRAWPVATFVIVKTSSEWDGAATLTLDLADATYPINSNLIHVVSWDAGTPVESVVGRLLDEVIPDSWVLAPTGYTLPAGSLAEGAERMQAIAQMLEGCGQELAATSTGGVSNRPIPPTKLVDPLTERWVYGIGGIPVDRASREWLARSPQGWRVDGGSMSDADAAVTSVVYDRDPTSQGFFTGSGPVTLGQSRFPFVRAASQAKTAGYGQLRRNGLGPLTVTFDTAPNPAIMEGDLIQVQLPDLKIDHTCIVVAFSLPIHLDGLMRVTARAVFDPEIGYIPPVEPNPVPTPSFVDDFQRDDQNLETTDSEAGSPDWTEIGWSWGVVGRVAVQRLHDNWCMGLVNTALETTDHYAEVDIVKIPRDRFLGPACRSGGGYDGYIAHADDDGMIRLELWLNSEAIETLGSHDAGGSVAGQTLRVSAVGTRIRVELASAVVIDVTDDRRTGPYVGMSAYGGTLPDSPTVGAFRAGVAV
jgi:hypothetical protein